MSKLKLITSQIGFVILFILEKKIAIRDYLEVLQQRTAAAKNFDEQKLVHGH